jgi:aminoglycoside phosphotransferase family enzyme
MDETSQSDAIEFLHRVCSEAGDNTPPALTHISRVFFAGARVFKLKRAVLKPYLDFSSPELRCKACARELELNRRTAQSLYIALRRITREPAGLVFDGPGELVDCIVEMQRFDEDLLLDRMAQRDALTPLHMDTLAHSIVAMHTSAEVREGGAAPLARVLSMNKRAVQESFLNNARPDGAGAHPSRQPSQFARQQWQNTPMPRRSHPSQHRVAGRLTDAV